MSSISIDNYGNYKVNNGNTTIITIGNLELYFSYKTIVAFKYDIEFDINGNLIYPNIMVCDKKWSRTTTKHLYMLQPDKSKWIPYHDFNNMLDDILISHNLKVI